MDDYSKVTTKLNTDPNLHFILREGDMERSLKQPTVQSVEMALKKGALYGNRVIILTKPQTIYLKDKPEDEDHWKYFSSGNTVSQGLKELYDKLNPISTFQKTFYFLPERIDHITETWEDDDWVHSFAGGFHFAKAYHNKFGIEMSLSHPTINSHVLETLECRSDELSVQNVWLPELVNVPLDILLKVKDDEGDAFTRFHFALKEFLANSEELESEAKAIELFQRVDYEVRVIEARMSQISKSRALAAYQAILGVSVMGLCLAVPSEVSQIISAAIGVYGGKDFVSHLFREREQVHELKSSNFYVPWLCTRKQKNRKNAK